MVCNINIIYYDKEQTWKATAKVWIISAGSRNVERYVHGLMITPFIKKNSDSEYNAFVNSTLKQRYF